MIKLETLKKLYVEAEPHMVCGSVVSEIGNGIAVYFLRHSSFKVVEAYVMPLNSTRRLTAGESPKVMSTKIYQIETWSLK